MLFNSWTFALFFVVVFILYRPLNRRWQNLLLLVASYFFYGWWDWRFLGLLALSTFVDYNVGRRMPAAGPRRRRALLLVSLLTNLGILGFFKYFNFFVDSAATLLESLGLQPHLPILSIILPVGISFYTFQTMAYTIDVYRGKVEPSTDPILFGVYVAYFPQLVAGPIERAQNILPQLSVPRRATGEQISSGVLLILIGLVRKVAIADVAAPFVNEIFADVPGSSGYAIWAAVLLFSLQIYGDFAGYSDIARGLSRILGIELMINFNHPYFATNLANFWRKWHISLSTWLRDYLYIPLGGNRNGRFQTYRNLMVTMLLGGLWHGARWTFVIWGAIHGVALSVNRFWSERSSRRRPTWLSVSGGWLLTMAVVVFAWVFFRSVSLESAADALVAMVTLSGELDRDTLKLFALFVVLLLAVLAIDIPQARSGTHTVFLKWRAPLRGLVYAAMILTILLVPADPNIPFIYFQF